MMIPTQNSINKIYVLLTTTDIGDVDCQIVGTVGDWRKEENHEIKSTSLLIHSIHTIMSALHSTFGKCVSIQWYVEK